MNIVIISSTDIRGGAARAAHRLHQGLRLLGQDPVMIVREKRSRDPDVCQVRVKSPEFQAEQNIFWAAQKHAIDLNRTDLSNTFFTLPYPGYDISKNPLVGDADVINLHWVAQFQSVETITRLLRLGKPVVWTLHDENPYTGGCHYTAGCRQYQIDCKNCPQLENNHHQIPSKILRNKLGHWRGNLTLVTPSRWLAEQAKQGRVFQNRRFEVIPNSLETDVFKPLEKGVAKKSIKINREATCILFVAEYHSEKRKGFRKLMESLAYCLKNPRFRKMVQVKKIHLLTIGDPQQELVKLGIPVTSFGYMNSDRKLTKVYSAADIFVLPSREDNLPNTMLESMACGTPVVSFRVGGMPDVIQDHVTGRVVPPFHSNRLGEAIMELVFDPGKREQMGKNCRQLVEEKYKLQDQAGAYLRLFQELDGGRQNKLSRVHYKELVRKNRKIVLQDRRSQIREEFFNIYKNGAIQAIRQREVEINHKGRNPHRPNRGPNSRGPHYIPFTKKIQYAYLQKHRAGRILISLLKFARNCLRRLFHLVTR